MCTARWFSYMFFRLFSIKGYYKILSLLSMLQSKSLLLIYFMYNNLYLLTHTPKPKTHFIWYHLYVESKKKMYKWICIQNRNRLINMVNILIVTKGERKYGDKLGVWDQHIHTTHIKYIINKDLLNSTWNST